MKILTIYEVHNAAAALSIDGYVVAANLEERFTGKKNQMGLPVFAAHACLNEAGLKGEEIDKVILINEDYDQKGVANIGLSRMSDYKVEDWIAENRLYWKPKLLEQKELGTYYKIMSVNADISPWTGHSHPYLYCDLLHELLMEGDAKVVELFKKSRVDSIKKFIGCSNACIEFVDHYLCHHYHAFYSAKHGESADRTIIVHAEGDGGKYNHAVSRWDNQKGIEFLFGTRDFGLGRLYQWTTLMLKMKPYAHEFKLMGLAPYSEHLVKEIDFKLLDQYFGHTSEGLSITHTKPKDFYYTFMDLFEGLRFDVVASLVQSYLERSMCSVFSKLCEQFPGTDSFCYGGGVAMNIRANAKINSVIGNRELKIPFASADEGNVIGACYYVQEKHLINKGQKLGVMVNRETTPSPYLGTYMRNDQDSEWLTDCRLEVSELDTQSIERIAQLLYKGSIGAVARGRYEYGQRALGARSIIASPHGDDVVEKINRAIKGRDFWMPFAPSITLEDYALAFNSSNGGSHYMTCGASTNSKYHKILKGALHPADKSARPHIVDRLTNPWYHGLLVQMKDKIGVSCLLNTSFNRHNRPIVNSLSEALDILLESGLDFLVLDEYLVVKKGVHG